MALVVDCFGLQQVRQELQECDDSWSPPAGPSLNSASAAHFSENLQADIASLREASKASSLERSAHVLGSMQILLSRHMLDLGLQQCIAPLFDEVCRCLATKEYDRLSDAEATAAWHRAQYQDGNTMWCTRIEQTEAEKYKVVRADTGETLCSPPQLQRILDRYSGCCSDAWELDPFGCRKAQQFRTMVGEVRVEVEPHLPEDLAELQRLLCRIQLLEEELQELQQAIDEDDLVEVADALVDFQYVLSGTINALGFQGSFPRIFSMVLEGNSASSLHMAWSQPICNLQHHYASDPFALQAVWSERTLPHTPALRKEVSLFLQRQLAISVGHLRTAMSSRDLERSAMALAKLQIHLSRLVNRVGMRGAFTEMYCEVHRSNMTKECDSMEIAEATVRWYREEREEAKRCEACIIPAANGKYHVIRTDNGSLKMLKSKFYSEAQLQPILERWSLCGLPWALDPFGSQRAELSSGEGGLPQMCDCISVLEGKAEMLRRAVDSDDLLEVTRSLLACQHALSGTVAAAGIQFQFPGIFAAVLADPVTPNLDIVTVASEADTRNPDESLVSEYGCCDTSFEYGDKIEVED
mmetsp:Transcript_42191/g.98988  ORF Transcript_42191/g.98988 Transcript_42191/m.98988 type:complete len:583 (-) Transcript_42191:125-1873(-)